MLGFGKNDHDSIDSALLEVFGDGGDNCGHFTFENGVGEDFCIQYLARDGDRYINITGIDDMEGDLRSELIAIDGFENPETHVTGVTVEGAAETAAEARDEIDQALLVICDTANVTGTKSFDAGFATVRENLASILGLKG